MKIGKLASRAGKHITQSAQTAHGQLEVLPQAPAWSGYWTFVTATIIFAFILYLAQKSRLNAWIAFFSWSTPAQVGTTGAPSNSQTTGQQLLNGPAGNASIPATTPGQANAIPWGQVGSTISKTWNSFINPGFTQNPNPIQNPAIQSGPSATSSGNAASGP